MNVICSICSDPLVQTDDIFYTRCGHVFHLHCLTPWLERSKSCPQCREKVTQSKIHRLYFTFSNNEAVEPQCSTLQEKVDSLKFQILLKDKHIQHYSSKNVSLGKQNVGLKQEVRKVESELNEKNAAIHALKEQITYFKGQNSDCRNLKREIAQLKDKIEMFRPMQVLLNGSESDVSDMIGETKDPETLIMYIAVMKKQLIKKYRKCKELNMTVKRFQELSNSSTKSDTSLQQQLKQMELEEKLAFSESKNIALQKRVDELEEILDINEEYNSVLEVQRIQNKINISTENSIEEVSTNDKQSNKSSTFNYVAKRKMKEISVRDNSAQNKMHDSSVKYNTNDAEDFINCSSSTDSSTVSKRLKLLENNINNSDQNDSNKFSNNFISKKKKNINTKKKVFRTKDKRDNQIIDLS